MVSEENASADPTTLVSSFICLSFFLLYEAKSSLSAYQALGRILGELDVLLRDVVMDDIGLSTYPHSSSNATPIKL